MKYAGAVRADLDAGTHLSQPRGLFVHVYIEAALEQRKCGRQATYTSADDGDGVGRGHYGAPRACPINPVSRLRT